MAGMRGRTGTTLWSVVLDSLDANSLSKFYLALLDWEIRSEEPGWVTIHRDAGVGYMSFQTNDTYVSPTWPAGLEHQQMQMHLDIEVRDLPRAVEDAIALGARQADFQPQDDVRVMLDPAGHPFCLWLNPNEP
jgi:hypothetical protein